MTRPKKPKPKRTLRKMKNHEVGLRTATLNPNKNRKMLYKPLKLKNCENTGLLDTGTFESALSKKDFRRILTTQPKALLQESPPHNFKTKVSNSNNVLARKQVNLRFRLDGKVFGRTSMVL